MNDLPYIIGITLILGAPSFGLWLAGHLDRAEARYRQYAGEDGGEGWGGAHASLDSAEVL